MSAFSPFCAYARTPPSFPSLPTHRYTEPEILSEIYRSQGLEYSTVGGGAAQAAAQAEEQRMHSSSMDATHTNSMDGIDDGGFDHYDEDEGSEEMYGGGK